MEGLGPGNVKKLMKTGYDTVAKILAMNLENYLEVDGFKINHLLWEQSEILKSFADELFIDCKLWDTPNTVEQVLNRIIKKGATMTTISTHNNDAVFEVCEQYANDIKLLGVTYLTSWTSSEVLSITNINAKIYHIS